MTAQYVSVNAVRDLFTEFGDKFGDQLKQIAEDNHRFKTDIITDFRQIVEPRLVSIENRLGRIERRLDTIDGVLQLNKTRH